MADSPPLESNTRTGPTGVSMRCVGSAPPVLPLCDREDKRARALSMREASMLGAKGWAMGSKAERLSVVCF